MIPKSEAGTDLFQAYIFEETLFTTGKSILDFPRIFSAGYPVFRSDEIRRNRGLIMTIESPEFKLCSIGELFPVSKIPFDQLHGSNSGMNLIEASQALLKFFLGNRKPYPRPRDNERKSMHL